jgi:hypothetical protein
MLTRIAAVTAVVSAAVNLAVLFGWDLTAEQIAGINALVVAAGAAIHVWFNPDVAPNRTP